MNSQGETAARGKRKPVASSVRFHTYRALRIAGTRRQRSFPDYVEFAPAVRDAREFSDLSTRVATYLGDAGVPLYLPGPHFSLDAELVPHFDPDLVRDPGWLTDRPLGDGYLAVHRVNGQTLNQMMRSRVPARVVDVRLHAYSEMSYFSLRDAVSWPTYPPVEVGLDMLSALRGSSAFILATGPSALSVDLAEVDADVRITCNSAVRDLDRIKEFRPSIIACTDPVFHFGPSRYAAGFRRDLLRAAEAVDAIVLCGHEFAGPLLGLAPALSDRLAVIPQRLGGSLRWPTPRNPTVRQVGNVLTGLMLPIGLMLADDVAIAGADGREPGENYFWTHNAELQYSDDLMRTVFDSHPAFFRDRDYADYYAQYCEDLEGLAVLAEGAGKRVRAAAPSWIPALRDRGATTPEPKLPA